MASIRRVSKSELSEVKDMWKSLASEMDSILSLTS